MKTMKKFSALLLVLVIALSFAACGKNEGSNASTSPEIAKYVEEYGDTIEDGIEESAGEGVDCEVKARGNKIVITMSADAFNGLTDDQKKLIQDTYDSMKGDLKEMVEGDVGHLKDLEAVIYEVCDGNGEVIASINIEF